MDRKDLSFSTDFTDWWDSELDEFTKTISSIR